MPHPSWKLLLSMKVKVLVAQSCLTLVTPWTVCIPPGSSVHGILQARILEWVALSFSRGSFRPRDQIQVSCTAEILYWLSHQGSPLLNSPLFFLLWNTPKMMPWRSIHICESPSSKNYLSLLSASLEKKRFIYLFLAALGLCCCTQTFSTCSEWA